MNYILYELYKIKKNVTCFILLLSCLAGCGKQIKIKSADFLHQEEIIAKFSDLPDTPFQAHLQKIAILPECHDQLQLFYTITMPCQDVVAFYQQQMERLGWEFFAESNTHDYLLYYSKPQQICSILISGNHLSIYICNKKDA